ncbi:MAG TPA: hypothetical protein VGD17_11415 [Chitinophagaceae bacterium]
MKRLFALILAIIYLGASSGATVHFHYCMNELVSWGLENQAKENCGNCGMKIDDCEKACCKDEHKQLKLQESNKAVQSFIDLVSPSTILSAVHVESGLIFLMASSYPLTRNHIPPLLTDNPVYILNCVFRI